MKQTRQAVHAITQSILLRCQWFHYSGKKSFIAKKWKNWRFFYLDQDDELLRNKVYEEDEEKEKQVDPNPIFKDK